MREAEASALELATAALAPIEALNPRLNAVITPALAREQLSSA